MKEYSEIISQKRSEYYNNKFKKWAEQNGHDLEDQQDYKNAKNKYLYAVRNEILN